MECGMEKINVFLLWKVLHCVHELYTHIIILQHRCKKKTRRIVVHVYSCSRFRPTMRNIGVNMPILPDFTSDDAPTCKTEWTLVTPFGATERVSSTVRKQWVTILPMADTRKLWREQPLPSRNEYLAERWTMEMRSHRFFYS